MIIPVRSSMGVPPWKLPLLHHHENRLDASISMTKVLKEQFAFSFHSAQMKAAQKKKTEGGRKGKSSILWSSVLSSNASLLLNGLQCGKNVVLLFVLLLSTLFIKTWVEITDCWLYNIGGPGLNPNYGYVGNSTGSHIADLIAFRL